MMVNRVKFINVASSLAYGFLGFSLAFLFVRSHEMALSVAQPMIDSIAYTANVTGWLRDERRLLTLIFSLIATPLVVLHGIVLCRSLVKGREALSCAFASLLSLAALFAMSWLGPYAFFLLPLPALGLVFCIGQRVKAPTVMLKMSVLAEVITLAMLSCYSLWWFAVFVE